MNSGHDNSKRRFVKAMAYVGPAILTLKAMPSYASSGSGKNGGGQHGGHGHGGGHQGGHGQGWWRGWRR